jgi:hypothetical protein
MNRQGNARKHILYSGTRMRMDSFEYNNVDVTVAGSIKIYTIKKNKEQRQHTQRHQIKQSAFLLIHGYINSTVLIHHVLFTWAVEINLRNITSFLCTKF